MVFKVSNLQPMLEQLSMAMVGFKTFRKVSGSSIANYCICKKKKSKKLPGQFTPYIYLCYRFQFGVEGEGKSIRTQMRPQYTVVTCV